MRSLLTIACIVCSALIPASAAAQIKATLPKGPMTPAWDKGILPINRESYWNAVECGKQGGERPLCVFYDAGLCPNPDFTLALYSNKQVAYEVWQAVHKKQPAPTPSYVDAQKTRITVGITPVRGSKNPITAPGDQARTRQVVKPATQSLDDGGGRFIFDFAGLRPDRGDHASR